MSGPAAHATAAFSDTCGTQGKVRATAYAEAFSGPLLSGSFRSSLEIDPASGWRHGTGSAVASASAAVVAKATDVCYSYGRAEVVVYDSLGNPATFTRFVENNRCQPIGLPAFEP